MNINQETLRSQLARDSKFLLRWGWFVALSVILVAVCSSLLPDISTVDSYQATLQVQVQLPVGSASITSTNITTTFFSDLLTSPGTLRLALPQINKLPQFRDLQLSDLQGLVTAAPVTDDTVIMLNAVGDTPQDAGILVTDVYQAFLQKVQGERYGVIDALIAALSAEQQHVQQDLANSKASLDSLSATGKTSTFQYRLLNALRIAQQQRTDTINGLLLTLRQEVAGNNDMLRLGNSVPAITTLPGVGPAKNQRLALSPLVGLIMGLGGAILASRFSSKVPLRGKKRELILPHISTVIPVIPNLSKDRLQMLIRTSSHSLPLLRRLRYQASANSARLQLITVTSPKGREGKSTISTSLAIASAHSGLRTLLVDANPRRPVLHTWFQAPRTNGTLDAIRSLASGGAGLPPIQSTFEVKLALLPIGNTNLQKAPVILEEELRIDGLRPFIELLRRQADLIIFDGPPLFSDINTVNLMALSDIVLLVVDAIGSQSSKVLESQALLSEIGVSFTTVLNRVGRESVE